VTKVVVIGGGWAGCAAALAAARAGASVTLLERTDTLLGTGLVGGIMRNNGRYTAAEEIIAMGGGDLVLLTDKLSRHRNVNFPGHRHATLYDVLKIEPAVRRLLQASGVEVRFFSRVTDVVTTRNRIELVRVGGGERVLPGDVFVDATGTAGPPSNCRRYGHGCAMCILRCPTFGPRVSIAARVGVKELVGRTAAGTIGPMSGSCKLLKESLCSRLVSELETRGVVVYPIPSELQKIEALALKACQQYAIGDFARNLILLDTGHVKLMASYFPLEMLRQLRGFEAASFHDPVAGGVGNSVRFAAITPGDDFLRVQGVSNLFCAGEKAGALVGHTEAMLTGLLAGHNAVRLVAGKNLLSLPTTTACGDLIAFSRRQILEGTGLTRRYTFSGSVFFERMVNRGLYTTEISVIKNRVRLAGVTGCFSKPVITRSRLYSLNRPH